MELTNFFGDAKSRTLMDECGGAPMAAKSVPVNVMGTTLYFSTLKYFSVT